MSKYKVWYNNIIDSAIHRTKAFGFEYHHIIPDCLGGLDTLENMVYLTPREHFICHWLLTKIYSTGQEHHKMLNALRMMKAENPNQKRYETKITARVYENLKLEYSKLQSKRFSGKGNGFYGKQHTAEAKQRISEANKGRVQPQHEKEKQIAAISGRKRAPFSEEHKQNLSKAGSGENNSMYGKTHSDETKRKIGDKIRGRKQTEEEKRRRGLANLGKKKPKKLCPHCNREIAVNGYARWHGDKCKDK